VNYFTQTLAQQKPTEVLFQDVRVRLNSSRQKTVGEFIVRFINLFSVVVVVYVGECANDARAKGE